MIKGAKTIREFKILRNFIIENFEENSINAVFVGSNEAILYDKIGSSAKVYITDDDNVEILKYEIVKDGVYIYDEK